jgi:hypothetical protein
MMMAEQDLHPKIQGALVGLREKAEHVAAMREIWD